MRVNGVRSQEGVEREVDGVAFAPKATANGLGQVFFVVNDQDPHDADRTLCKARTNTHGVGPETPQPSFARYLYAELRAVVLHWAQPSQS